MAEQIFIDNAQVEDVAEGEEVFAGAALFSEDEAADADVAYNTPIIHSQAINRSNNY